MSAVVVGLAAKLAELAMTNTASAVFTKMEALKARSEATERETGLIEIIHQLLQEKAEVVAVAQGLEQELSAERMTEDEMKYIGETLVPKLREVMRKGNEVEAGDLSEPNGVSAMVEQARQVEASLDILDTMFDRKTFQVMQLMGFNIRRAFGEPLTETLRAWILALSPEGLSQLSRMGEPRD